MNQETREAWRIICDMGYEEAVVFDSPSYDEAIIGVTDEGRVVYDYNKMVHSLRIQDGMTEEEAIEFLEYNTIRACAYVENAPIIMHPIEN